MCPGGLCFLTASPLAEVPSSALGGERHTLPSGLASVPSGPPRWGTPPRPRAPPCGRGGRYLRGTPPRPLILGPAWGRFWAGRLGGPASRGPARPAAPRGGVPPPWASAPGGWGAGAGCRSHFTSFEAPAPPGARPPVRRPRVGAGGRGPPCVILRTPRGGAAGPRRRRPRRASRRPLPGARGRTIAGPGAPGAGQCPVPGGPLLLSSLGPGPPAQVRHGPGRCPAPSAAGPRGPAPGPPRGHEAESCIPRGPPEGLTGRRDAGTPSRAFPPPSQYPPGRRDVGYNFFHPP